MLREASWSRSNSSWGISQFKRPNDILAASSGFDQRSMTISVSSRILEIAEGLPTIRPQCAGQGHHSSALGKKTHTAFIYIASHDGQQTPKRKTFIGRFPFVAYLVLPYDDCPEGRALGGCSKLILIPTLPKLDGSLVLPVTLFAPSTAGIVLTGFVTGRNGLRAFFTASIR